MKLIPTRYFFRKNLEPASLPTAQALPILPDKILERIKSLAIELRDKSYAELPTQYLDEHPDMAVFVGVIHSIGAARVVDKDEKLRLQVTGPLGGDVAYAFFLMLQYRFICFCIKILLPDNNKYTTIPSQITNMMTITVLIFSPLKSHSCCTC